MEMHALPQKYVFEALYRNGLRPIEVCPFPVIGPIGISYLFLAHKTENTPPSSEPSPVYPVKRRDGLLISRDHGCRPA